MKYVNRKDSIQEKRCCWTNLYKKDHQRMIIETELWATRTVATKIVAI